MRAERNADCETCDGRIRFYPLTGSSEDSPMGMWSHLNRADWINDPHDPVPSDEAVAAATLTPT